MITAHSWPQNLLTLHAFYQVVNCVLRCRERLIKPLVQDLDGTLPGNVSSLSVILMAILLEEPMFGPWIRIDGDWSPRSLERLPHLRGRLSRLEGVVLREVAEVCGRSSAIVQSGVGVIKGHDCGDLLGQGIRLTTPFKHH